MLAGVARSRRQPAQFAPAWQFEVLHTRTGGRTVRQLNHVEAENSADPRHFVWDGQALAVGQIEMRIQAVDRDDQSGVVVALPPLNGRSRIADDGFLSETTRLATLASAEVTTESTRATT